MTMLLLSRNASPFSLTMLLTALLLLLPSQANSQDNAVDDDRERLTAERFLQVLMKRPRPGTSLDRVYGYHVRDGSLDGLLTALEKPEGQVAKDFQLQNVDRGPAMMVLGLLQLQRGKSAAAVQALKSAEELMPKDAACSYYLGKAHLAIGETELAAAAMERAIERGPARNEALPIFTELGRIYGRAGAAQKALSVWNRLEQQFPGDSRVGGQIANTLADEGNVEEALKRFEALSTSARKDEDKIAFAIQAAEMKRRLGKPEEATSTLEAILNKLRPGSWLHTDVRNRIEDGFLKSGDVDALADYYQGRLKNDKDNLELMTRLGRILVSASRLEEASTILKTAVERAPEDVEVRLALVDVFVRQANVSDAGKQYAQLAKQDPTNPDYLLKWGQLLLEDQTKELADRRTAAAAIWQRLADARHDDAVTLAQVADRLRSVNQTDDAIALYRKAIEIDPTAPQYREYLGEYFHQLDRKDEAIETWESIADGDRRGVESLIRLAEIFATFKLSERSLENWKAASEFDFTFSQELRYANQLRGAKQFDDALARLEIAEKIAETPDERDQILSDRITTYSEAGTLPDMIAALEKIEAPATGQLKELALMHQAAGQLTDAFIVVQKALEKEPENIAVLSVAAEVLERQNRFSDAADYYRKLANVDRRFQTNYLEKVAQLQVRLGLADDALKTCEELIQANPASTDTYLFAARTAFQLGRTDEGIEVLRRAMTVARRDNGPRKMLASEFAKQYRTDEAIDLYWQALDFESKLDNRIDIVRSLAPLYERRTEIETLLSRIEDLGAKDNDVRATQMMIAAANEAIQDYGSARQAIDRLLARQPRDVSLLESMVRLCDAANELELAIEFQQRIVTLADTPENRYRLVNLQLDAGTIDIKTVLSQRMSMAKDPSRLMSMIQGATRRGDSKTAAFVAREAIKSDDSLWDVKLMLAQLLLHETVDEEPIADDAANNKKEGGELTQPRANPHEEAVALCEQILTADFPLDDPAPTAKTATSSSRSASSRTSARYWGQSGYRIARQYQLGQYSRYNYGRQQSIQTVLPYSFGHAKILAQTLIWVPKARTLGTPELTKILEEEIQKHALPEDLNEVSDTNTIWKYQALVSTASSLVEGSLKIGQLSPEDAAKRAEQISWRQFELDPKASGNAVMTLLQGRLVASTAKETPENAKSKQDPLDDSRLALLVKYYDQRVADIEKNPKASKAALLSMTAVLRHEFELAGKTNLAAKYQPEAISDDASLQDVLAGIRFYLSIADRKKANELVPRLLTAVRMAQTKGATISGVSRGSLNGTLGSLATSNDESSSKFLKDNRLQLLDAIFAAAIHNQAVNARRQRAISTGTVQVYHQSPTGGYRSAEVRAPLSPELMDESLARELTSINQVTLAKSEPRKVSDIDDQIIQHLLKPLPDAPVYEQKARSACAAFAYWWKEQPQECYRILASMSEQYPDDVNIRIEHARLASELGNDREALDILNSFEPLDSKMLVRKEMAALNLAARVADEKRSAQAAERLFGMRMDTTTQLALSEQLRQLGMKEKAAAVLQRLRGGRKQDDSTRLQIARSFMTAGDKEAAAEVAFQVLRNVNRSRNQQGNVEYYRSQSINILKSANRLDPLIAMAKRRVESAPKSVSARTELAELYTAAGKKDEADKLWTEISKDAPSNPTQLMSQAKGLDQAGKHKEAVAMYLKAFQKEPQLINNSYYELMNAVRQAKNWDEMYTGMLKIPASRIPEYRIDEFIEGDYNNRSKEFSDAKMKFAIHVMQSGSAGRSLDTILSRITDEQKEKYPQVRQAIIKTVTSDSAFQPNSPTWGIRSYSSNGKVNGGVQSVIEFLAADEEARAEFQKAAEKQLKKTETGEAYMARFLTSLVQLKAGEKPQVEAAVKELLAVIKELESKTAKTASPRTPNNWNGHLPEAFLWQAGNLINTVDDIPDKSEFLLTVYESAQPGESGINGGDPRYSILYPMIEEYKKAGKSDQAVQRLVKAYRSLDNSEQNQYNPGYGDYQDLQSWKWIAEQLQSCGAPFQSLAIYRRALGDPSKFEKANRWGGSQGPEPYQIGAKKAAASINEESAIQFLESQRKQLTNEESAARSIDLMMLPIASFEEAEVSPGFLMAINEAKKSEPGISCLKDLAKALQNQASHKDADWSLTAAQLMIAAAIDSESVQDLTDQLMALLPDQEQIKANPTQQTPFLDCFAVGLALSQSDYADSKPLVQKIKSLLIAIVNERSDSTAMLVLEKRFGDPLKAINLLLTELESETEGRAPNKDQVALALKIAMTSAKEKNWTTSTRAFKAALGQGPPLVGISTNTTGDAFAITNNRSSSNGNEPTDHRAILNAEVLELVDVYRTHLQLEKQQSDSWKAANVSPEIKLEIKKDAEAIFDALLQVVIPQSKLPMVAMYEREIASSRNYDQIQNGRDGVMPRSVSKTLVEVAALTNRFDDLINRLSDRVTTESAESSTLRIQIALKQNNEAKLAKAIDDFEALVDNVLPPADAQMVSTSGTYSISSSMQTESFAKSRVLNQVMHAVWEISQQKELNDTPASESADRVLKRAVALIGSDQYTMQRHRQILEILQSRSAQQAAASGDQSLLSSMIQGMTQSIANQYAGSNPEYMVQAQKRSLTGALFPMIEAGNIAQTHGVIRQIIECDSKVRRNYKSVEAAIVMRAISELPKDQQYDLLKKITFGTRKDSPILHWVGFVRASEVPKLVRKQTPDFGKHSSLPLCSDDIPITDTALMLARLAIDLGDTDALMKQIADRGENDQQAAKLLSALVTILRDGNAASSQLSGFFTDLLKTLRANNPPANDRDLQLPDLEFLVISQAIQAGVIPDLADPLTNVIKTYSMKAQQYEFTAIVGVLRAGAGIGRAAGGSVASPLKHFISMSIPWYQGPESLNMRPLHAVNENGWVSSTGGYNVNLLMLKYPVTGSFTVDAVLRDGSYGDSDISYGGTLYQTAGWNSASKVKVLRGGATIQVPVANIKKGKENKEGLKITPQKITGLCNDVPYLEDHSSAAYPWASVSQNSYRTTQWKDFQITGDAVIPSEVNLLDPMLRGWTAMGYSGLLPPTLLPSEDGKKAEQSDEVKVVAYEVNGNELNLKVDLGNEQADPGGAMQYLRPLLHNETVSWQFFWKKDVSEIHPMVGRVSFVLSDKGAVPHYAAAAGDLSTTDFIPAGKLEPQQPPVAAGVIPKDGEWNKISMTRQQDVVQVRLNGQMLVELPVTDQTARFGFTRPQGRSCQIKHMILTGDWPETLPQNLMERAQ